MSAIVRNRWWRPFVVHGSIVATAVSLGLASWFIAKPLKIRLLETVSGQRQTFAATPEIDVSLDADSSVAVSNTEPPQIELLRGNAFFSVNGERPDKLQVKVGTTYIRDTGTRFSVSKWPEGGSVAVASGQVEILVKTGTYLVGAHERADFDGVRVMNQRMIGDAEIAPWHVAR